MSEKKEEQKKSFYQENWFLVCYAIFIVSAFLIGGAFSFLNNLVEKNYLASLTPQERVDIAHQKELEKQQAKEEDTKYWGEVYKSWTKPVEIPSFMFWILMAIPAIWIFKSVQRGRW